MPSKLDVFFVSLDVPCLPLATGVLLREEEQASACKAFPMSPLMLLALFVAITSCYAQQDRFNRNGTVIVNELYKQFVAVDLDRDGDIDIVGGFPGWADFSVYENKGDGKWKSHRSSKGLRDTITYLSIGDVNGDGLLDVIVSGDETFGWMKNNGNLSFEYESIQIDSSKYTYDVCAADFNGDSYSDIVVIDTESVFYFERNEPGKSWSSFEVYSTGASRKEYNYYYYDIVDVLPEDLNSDGLLDLVVALNDSVVVKLNTARYPRFDGPWKTLYTGSVYQNIKLAVGNFDNQTGPHIVLVGNGKLVYLRTRGTRGEDWEERVIDTITDYGGFCYYCDMRTVIIADYDGDGDDDIILHEAYGQDLWYYENKDANGHFAQRRSILSAGRIPGATVADVDGDEHVDLVAVTNFDKSDIWKSTMAWYRNGELVVVHEYIAHSTDLKQA